MAALSVDQILSGTSLGLTSGIDDLLLTEIGGRRVLFAVSRAENRLLEIEVAANGTLNLAGTLLLNGAFQVGRDPKLSLVSTGSGGDSLALDAVLPTDGHEVTLSAMGALGTQQEFDGVSTLEGSLGLGFGSVSVLLSGGSGGGLTYYSDSGAGFAVSDFVADTNDTYLGDVAASASFVSGTQTYVATISESENGLNLVAVDGTGLTQADAFGSAEGLPISGASDVATVTRMGESLVFVSSFGTSSLSVIQADSGSLRLADHVFDSDNTRFAEASHLAAVEFNDFVYVAVGGSEGGVSLFTVLPGGRLIHLNSVPEDETAPLDQIAALEAAVIGDHLYLFAGSGAEVGLTGLVYDLSEQGVVVTSMPDGSGAAGSALDDQLVGSVVGEVLNGLAGDDILLDGAGNDTLTGGSGVDLFAFSADGVWDQISDFERGIDRLDLSAFDFLYDVSQLEITPTGTGAVISFGLETIYLTTSDSAPLTAGDLSNDDILNVDRPPFLLIGREIVGTSADEVLNGGAGDDTIAGAGGDDSLTGNFGLDILLGGSGNDTLQGNGDRDTLIGSVGDDLLLGGDGNDVIYGDDWS